MPGNNGFNTLGYRLENRYNFDLLPLIDNFSIVDFCYDAIKNIRNADDLGGFAVITPKQIVFGYNDNFGTGTHLIAYARAYADINGLGKIQDEYVLNKYLERCKSEYVTCRLTADVVSKKGRVEYKFGFFVSFPDNMTYELYDMFKEFYDKYNEDIAYVNKKYGLKTCCCRIDEEGVKAYQYYDDLTPILEYIEKESTRFQHSEEKNEIILGGETRK